MGVFRIMYSNRSPGGTDYYGKGKVAISSLYDIALTAAEVKQNFEAHRSRFGI